MKSLQLCQLAGTWSGRIPNGALVYEQKHDGFRCLWLTGVDGLPRLFTRGGRPIEGCAHIEHRCRELEEAAGQSLFIDGELVVDGTLAATKHWVETGWKSGGEAGTFHAFDCLTMDEWRQGGGNMPLLDRKERLCSYLAAERDEWTWRPRSKGKDDIAPSVQPVAQEWAFCLNDVTEAAANIWQSGGEGLVLKDPDAPYLRHRSKAWQKVGRPWQEKLGFQLAATPTRGIV